MQKIEDVECNKEAFSVGAGKLSGNKISTVTFLLDES